jgi:GxxExxY protein
MDFDPLSQRVIGLMIEVHRHLGPGLLESAYQVCLAHELHAAGMNFMAEVPLPVRYKGMELDCAYRMDLVVERSLVVEIKAAEALLPIHEAQLLTYLRLSGHKTGLLVNFNVPLLRQGLKRLVL